MAARKITIDLPHLVFVTGIGGWCAWFCWDAWRSNSGVENLILIVPVSVFAVVLYLCVAAGCFRVETGDSATAPSSRGSAELGRSSVGSVDGSVGSVHGPAGSGGHDSAGSGRPPLAPGIGVKVAGSMALLAAFVVAGPLIGFDVACFVYMLAMLAFLGERRVLILLVVPLLFCAAAIYCFNNLLSTPLPLYFFAGNS